MLRATPAAACRSVARPASAGPGTTRYASIDVLKASGIIVVIWIHAFQLFGHTEPLLIQRLAFLTRFAVPAFFFASGFLYAQSRPLSLRQFASRRVLRILAPYVVASVLAVAFRYLVFSERMSRWQVFFEFATGGAWGIYYFVPLLLGAAIVGQGVFQFHWLAWPLVAGFWVLGLLSEMWIISFGGLYWQMRSPLRWWGYFFAGWVAARHYPALQHLGVVRRRCIGGATLVIAATAFLYYVLVLPAAWSPQAAVLQYIGIYGIVGGLFLLTLDWPDVPVIRWLSEATYPMYLYHFFAVAAVHRWLAPPVRDPAAFVCGCAVSIVIVLVARRVLGDRARLVIG